MRTANPIDCFDVQPDEESVIHDAERFLFVMLHYVLLAAVVLACLAILSLHLYESEASHRPIAVGCGLAVLGLIAYARYVLRLPWISGSIFYLILFWMFHFGLAFTAVLVPDVLTQFTDRQIAWVYWPNVRLALVLGVIGAAGFVFGVGMVGSRHIAEHARSNEKSHDALMYGVGWTLMLGALGAAALVLVQGGGLGVLMLSYREFRAGLLGPTILSTAIDVSQLGCLLALSAAGGRRWVMPLVVWTPFAALLMLLGLRNEAMIPLVSFVVVLAHRGVRLNRGLLVAGLLAALVVIPAVKTVRAVGFANRSLVNWTEVSPLATVTELGGTLRATKAYVDWIAEGDEYLRGASYWAPLDRHVLMKVLPDRQPLPIDEDPRVPQRDMVRREGAVGDSAVGEAYYNFGPVGPFVFLTFVGVVFGWLERRPGTTPYRSAVLGIIMVVFFFNIRGDWLHVPAQLALALAWVGLCKVLATFHTDGLADRSSA